MKHPTKRVSDFILISRKWQWSIGMVGQADEETSLHNATDAKEYY